MEREEVKITINQEQLYGFLDVPKSPSKKYWPLLIAVRESLPYMRKS